ncbi:cupredoxin domain-containing protein [Streptomyces sp. NPDC051976]|uniref:cupredoxin domain-containing protein n=1 Tax=Streptomyces sp. NPDC051976 TaxID=3154947 RepID=UPI00342417FE
MSSEGLVVMQFAVPRVSVLRAVVPRTRPHVVLACALLALTGCSSSSSGSGGSTTSAPSKSATVSVAPGSGGGAVIVIKNFAFNPKSMPVAPGTVVTVKNEDSTTHTVTATTNGAFNTGDIAPGKSATFTAPRTTGSFAYICSIHPFMKGSLTVT